MLDTLFIILLSITLALFTVYYFVDSVEIEEYFEVSEVTGAMQSFEVSHHKFYFHHPTKKNTKRYDDKLFDYLEHIQEQRDSTFHKGKVFLKEK